MVFRKTYRKNCKRRQEMMHYDEWIVEAQSLKLLPSEWEVNIAMYMEYLNKHGYIIPVEIVMEGMASSRMSAISADLED